MRIDRRLVGLGLFLVTAGAVMLATRQGLIPEATAERAWTLWPLILVGVGLSIVLSGRPGAALGGLVVAMTVGAMLGGVAATGFAGGFGVCGGDREGVAFERQDGALTAGASVSIAVDCGGLDLTTAAGSGWSLGGSTSDGRLPEIDTSAGGLEIRNAERGPFAFGAGSNHWTVVLPTDPGFDLELTTNGGTSRAVLAGAAVRDVSVTTNAGSLAVDLRGVTAIADLEVRTNLGSTTVHLPERSLAGSIEVNAGSTAICVPPGAGLRIAINTVLGSSDLGSHGLVQTADKVWESPDFASATVRLDLQVHVNAGSLSLDPGRECAG